MSKIILITIAMITSAIEYFELKDFAKKLKVKWVGKKKEDLRADLIKAVKERDKSNKVKTGLKANGEKLVKKGAKKKEKEKKEEKTPTAVLISEKDIKLITGLPTKRERILKLDELGYGVPDFFDNELVAQHPTNCYAVLRSAGRSSSVRTHSEATKSKIRRTVNTKIADLNKLKEAAEK